MALGFLMSLAGILITERERKICVTDTEEEVMGKWRQKLEQCISCKPRNAKVCWQPPEARREEWKNSPSEPPEGANPADTLACKTGREQVSVV